MKTWQLQDAKSRFSDVIRGAEGGETQIVTKHGKEVAVVLNYELYLRLASGARSVRDSLRGSVDLTTLPLERDKTAVSATDLTRE